MTRATWTVGAACAVLLAAAGGTRAANFNATVAGGAWTTPATWVENSGFPAAGDTAIQAQAGTITLTANAAASHLSIRNGVVDLGANSLNLSSRLDVGQDGVGGQLIRSAGSVLTLSGTIFMNSGGILNLLGGDTAQNLYGYGGSGTTVNQGGTVVYSGQVAVDNGLTYNLGANSLTANRLDLGWGGGVGTLTRSAGSALTISGNIYMNNGSDLEVRAGDSIATLNMAGTGTTVTQTGNISNPSMYVNIWNAASYGLGANSLSLNRLDVGWSGGGGSFTRSAGSTLTVSGTIYMNAAATLDLRTGDGVNAMNVQGSGTTVTQLGNIITSGQIELGNAAAFSLGANSLTVGNNLFLGWGGGGATFTRAAGSVLSVASGTIFMNTGATLELRAGDSVNAFNIQGTGTTLTQLGNIAAAGTVQIYNSAAYALGANSLSTPQLRLGLDGSGGSLTRAAGSALTVSGTAFVGGGGGATALDLRAGDSIANLDVRALGAVTQLGHISVSGTVVLSNGGAHDQGAFNLSCNQLRLGVDGGAATFTRLAGGVLTVANQMFLAGGGGAAAIDLKMGDSIGDMDLRNLGTATSTAGGTATNGFTVGNWSNNGGTLTLTFNDPATSGFMWGLRWSGDRVATLTALQGAGKLIIVDNATLGNPAITYNNLGDGYTYIGFTVTDLTPPGWASGWPKADTAATDGFTVRGKIDEAGTAYYVVVADGAGAPSAAQVKAGQNAGGGAALKSGSFAQAANIENSAAVTGLASFTPYDVYVVAEDDEAVPNLQASATKVDVTTLSAGDVTPPSWISGWPKADTATDSSFTARAEIDEAGIAYYVVVADGAGAPSTAQVKAGQDSGGGAALKFGSIALAANTENTAAVTGLAAATPYDVYFVAEDGIPNLQLIVVKKDVSTTADITPPTWTVTWPKADTATLSGFTVRAQINEAGTAYYVVVEDGAGAPSAVQVKAGQDSGGGSPFASGSIVLAANTENTAVIASLDPTTAYDVYVVAEDATPNLQAAPVLLNISTVTRAPTTFNSTAAGGLWRTAATWIENAGFPLTGDTVFNANGGTNTLAANATANHLSIRNGVVETGPYDLTLGSRLDVGQDGPANNGSKLVRSAGSVLTVNGNIFMNNGGILNLLVGDTAQSLYGSGGVGTTVNQGGNVVYSGQVGVDNGLTYNLGANTLTASRLDVGQGGGSGTVSRVAGSALNISANIYVQRSELEVRAGDTLPALHCDNAATITQVGDVTYTGNIEGMNTHSVYNLGANHLTAPRLDLGQGGGTGFLNRVAGSLLTVQNIFLQRSALELRAGDTITGSLYAQNLSTVTQTGTVGNASATFYVHGGSSYDLGTSSLTVNQLRVGLDGNAGAFTRSAGSTLTASQVYVGGGGGASTFGLRAGDGVANLDIRALGVVTQAGNVTVSGTVGLQNGAAYDQGAGSLSCNQLRLGVDGGAATFTRSAGSVLTVVNQMYVAGGGGAAAIDLKVGDSIGDMDLRNLGTATSTVGGETVTGFTIANWSNNGGTLTLTFGDPSFSGYVWALRWSGDHVTTLNNLVTAGKLVLVDNATSGAPTITYNNLADGYTYIGFTGVGSAVPTTVIKFK